MTDRGARDPLSRVGGVTYPSGMDRDELEQWLLDSDPTLRWQVQTRASMAHEGDAARLLALQDADGQWAGGAYFPAGYTGEGPGQPWTGARHPGV